MRRPKVQSSHLEVVKQFDPLVDYKDAILFVMDYVEQNAHILNCANDSTGRDEMKRFFYTDFIGTIRTLVDGVEKELGMSTPADFRSFCASFIRGRWLWRSSNG